MIVATVVVAVQLARFVTDPHVKQVGVEAVVTAYRALHPVTVTTAPAALAVQVAALGSKPALPEVTTVHEMQTGVVAGWTP